MPHPPPDSGASRTGFPPLMASTAGLPATAGDEPGDDPPPGIRAARSAPPGAVAADAAAAIDVRNSLRFAMFRLPYYQSGSVDVLSCRSEENTSELQSLRHL